MKLRKYGKKQQISKRPPIKPAKDYDAADRFMATHELVERALCNLSVFEIAQAQRVSKNFRDVIKVSSQIRNAVACQSWLPPIDGKGPESYTSALPFQQGIDFDSGLELRSDIRYFRMESIYCVPTFNKKHEIVEIVFQHTIHPVKDLMRSKVNGEEDNISADLWRMLPLCPKGIEVEVTFKSNHRGWSTKKEFGSDSSLEDVYDWLVDVRDRRLLMGTHRTTPIDDEFWDF
ncbi:hypothetical protein PRZ48_008430 [Zasmidium cellare]|uniref:F-box domain-containing protein n=1 Tax=Zasmidium cellare TaxID=395010 RepID=A0ABR0EG74_ZASCE|nr:hypothetical protein PRZ48_008430 [Zasmidium cellare]